MNQATLPAGARLWQGLTEALRWWARELRTSFAPQIARWFADEATVTELACDGHGLRAADGKVLAPVAGETALSADWKNRDVRLTLDSGLVLQKRIHYPQAAEENLQDTVAFDLDR